MPRPQDVEFLGKLYALCRTYQSEQGEMPKDKACKVCGCHVSSDGICRIHGINPTNVRSI